MSKSEKEIVLESLNKEVLSDCNELSEFLGLDAITNYEWILETIQKYNECRLKKNRLTESYLLLLNQVSED